LERDTPWGRSAERIKVRGTGEGSVVWEKGLDVFSSNSGRSFVFRGIQRGDNGKWPSGRFERLAGVDDGAALINLGVRERLHAAFGGDK